MNKKRIGQFVHKSVGGEKYACYIPKPLPPQPSIEVSRFYNLLDKATNTLGELKGVTTQLPNAFLFLNMFMKKEALLSSQIEGTQSSLSDILTDEYGIKNTASNEVFRYIDAMEYGLKQIKNIPLSRRLICNIHKKLLSDVKSARPGEFRTSQNWVGGTRPGNATFVPPPPDVLGDCFSDLEKFLNNKPRVDLPMLIKVAMAHVQFETIHPFLDGNGRVGRLLITFMFCTNHFLKEPLLYLSLYFKRHKQQYYDLLQKVRMEGDWESWIQFFLEGVIETSNQVLKTTQQIVDLFKEDEKRIQTLDINTVGVLSTYDHFKKRPISTTSDIMTTSGKSRQTILKSTTALVDIGLLKEEKIRYQRNKVFKYEKYFEILEQGTEL